MGKEKEMNCKYIEEARIEVLRDALSDVTSTIRAQDNKASYIIAIVLFISGSYGYCVGIIKDIKCFDYEILMYYFPLIYFILAIFFLFRSYSPVSNPVEVLNKEDEEFGKDKFFSFYSRDKERKAETMANTFIVNTKKIEDICRIIYIEILKLSKIRERKIHNIKIANNLILIGSVFCISQIVSLFNFTFEFFYVVIVFESFRCIFYFIDVVIKK